MTAFIVGNDYKKQRPKEYKVSYSELRNELCLDTKECSQEWLAHKSSFNKVKANLMLLSWYQMPFKGVWNNNNGEFDPGSERTLAARLKHASRTVRRELALFLEWRTGE